MFMRAFTRHPRIFYMAIILLPKAWDIVVRTTSGDANFADITRRRLARIVLTALGSGSKDSPAFRLRMPARERAWWPGVFLTRNT